MLRDDDYEKSKIEHQKHLDSVLFKQATWTKFNRVAHGIQNRLTKQYYNQRREKGQNDPFITLITLHELVIKTGKYTHKEADSRRFTMKEIVFLTDTVFKDFRIKEIQGHYSAYDWSEGIVSDAEKLVNEMKSVFLGNLRIK